MPDPTDALPPQEPAAPVYPEPATPAYAQPAPPAPPSYPTAPPPYPPYPTAPAAQPAPVPPVAPAAKPKSSSTPWLGIIALAIVFGLTAGFGGGLIAALLSPSSIVSSGGGGTVTVLPESTEEAAAAAAAAAVPSVVNIDVSGGGLTDDGQGLPQDHPDVPISGSGSGVAFREAEDGGTYIITNDHVVDGATTIVVTTVEGDRYDATLVGADAESDLAVVKIDGELPLIELADEDSLIVGQMVVAIGSPFGLEQSVTSGVVSALHRSLPTSSDGVYPLVDVIQTDASINPGNSGGALVDRTGALVGIPSAIYSESGADDGIGFAIPIRTVNRVADELIESGSAQTPYLGIVGQTVDATLKQEKSLTVDQGAYVVEITAGTGAEKAGVKPGDVIVKLDDTKIRSMDELILAVRRTSVGDTVTLTIVRDGTEQTLDMTIGVKPSDLTTQ